MKISEKELEDWILEKVKTFDGIEELESKGLVFDPDAKIFSQVSIDGYGIADLIEIQSSFEGVFIRVIELKVVEANIDEIAQLTRYMVGLKRYVKRLHRGYSVFISGTLIAPSFSEKGDFVYLCSMVNPEDQEYEEINYLTFKYDLGSALEFKAWSPSDYYSINEKDNLKGEFGKELEEQVVAHAFEMKEYNDQFQTTKKKVI